MIELFIIGSISLAIAFSIPIIYSWYYTRQRTFRGKGIE